MLGKTKSKGFKQDPRKYSAGTPSQPQTIDDNYSATGEMENNKTAKYSGPFVNNENDLGKTTKYSGAV